ncbi:MAG: hypothetical protein COA42_17845 [Alteromonadaceae bacterium]|nr:MAG: hypothetical protein COA42_17845 [Alteromonadaceae bacterium]
MGVDSKLELYTTLRAFFPHLSWLARSMSGAFLRRRLRRVGVYAESEHQQIGLRPKIEVVTHGNTG